MLSKQSVQPKQFKLSLLKELLDFMTDHFTTEEQLMDQYDYPNIVQHRRMHKDFEARMYEKYRAVMAEEVVLNSELMALIRDWFVQHTGSEDKKTFTYINSSIDTNTTPDSLLQK